MRLPILARKKVTLDRVARDTRDSIQISEHNPTNDTRFVGQWSIRTQAPGPNDNPSNKSLFYPKK
jgi:hypothetical protein